MRILVDICHPAHAHFFYWPIQLLQERGHQVYVTSRQKEMTGSLLEQWNIPHIPLGTPQSGSLLGAAAELFQRNRALAQEVGRIQPQVLAGVGGIFVAQVGWWRRIPSVVFYDTEKAFLQNLLTYPFATRVVVSHAYTGWIPQGSERYRGYHELSYLHPDVFSADREVAVANGLAHEGNTFFLRLVGSTANHDWGKKGWSWSFLRELVAFLNTRGKVIISSEVALPADLQRYGYSGDPAAVHHVLAFSRLYIGESATMASEAVVLGVPAIYLAEQMRGYIDDQQECYGMVKHLNPTEWSHVEGVIEDFMAQSESFWKEKNERLLNDSENVYALVASTIEKFM